MDLRLIFLPIILFLGIVTSYEDWKEGKIRNKWILIAVTLGFITNFVLYANQVISLQYVGQLLLYSAFALIIGFFLWIINLWSAGDAKLFAAFFFLIPLTAYSTGGFLPIHLFINSISFLFFILVIKAMVISSGKQKISLLKSVLNPKRIFEYLILVFSLGWVTQIIIGFIRNKFSLIIPQGILTNIVGIMILSRTIRYLLKIKILKKTSANSTKFIISICILRIIFNVQQMLLIQFWKDYLTTTLAYALVILLVDDLNQLFVKQVPINELKPGMIPIEVVIKVKEKNRRGYFYMKTRSKNVNLSQLRKHKLLLFDISQNNISKEDICLIKKKYSLGKLDFKRLKVQETLSFAHFMGIGAILTLVITTNIVSYVLSIL